MRFFRYILLFVSVLTLNFTQAQNLMNIHQGNGTLVQIPLQSIDSVLFVTFPPPTIQKIFQNNGNILSIAVNDIDSITYTIPNIAALASLTTQPVTVLSSSSAFSGGTITSDGGSPIIQRGVCWSTSPNPTLANNFTVDGAGIGSFGSNVIPLQSATIYYIRSYAINSTGTAYGNQLSFTTQNPSTSGSIATVATSNVVYTSGFTASCGGNITDDGGLAVTSRGVCWAIGTTPTINNNITTDGAGGGSYNSTLTNLLPNTSYFVRAYATNNAGTAYGITYSFTTFNLPTVTTTPISSITTSSANSGGAVTTNGGSAVSAWGVCWSTSPNPTLANSFVTNTANSAGFSSAINGLTQNTTYYVRAYATNSIGTAYGNQETFTTLTIVVPTVTTSPVSLITTSSANSGGAVTFNGNTTVTDWGVCWSTSPNPTLSNSVLQNTVNSASFSSMISGLTQNTIYYVRAYATNSAGTAYGNQETFSTLAVVVPTVITSPTSSITATSANSGGAVTSNGGGNITAWGVCWSTSPNPTLANSFLANTANSAGFSSVISGLILNTTYYVRAYATNSAGTSYGNQETFTTLNIPTVTTTPISSITISSANSGGAVTSNGGATVTSWGICWSTSPNPTIANSFLQNTVNSASFSSAISGLIQNTTYYVRAYATNSAGTAYGNQEAFTTLAIVVPTVTTSPISSITTSSANSGGAVTSNGYATVTSWGVCWSTSPNPTIANNFLANTVNSAGFSSALSGLTQNTTYYVRAYATNSAGTAYGNQETFTTLAIVVPTVTTLPITSISATSANSGGAVTNNGGGTLTGWGICWSTAPNPTIANSFLANTANSGGFNSALSGLSLNTTYFVRAYATNSAGTAYGNQETFTTLNIPTVTTSPITSITTSSASSGGAVTNNGGATVTAWGVCWSTSPNPTLANSTLSNTVNSAGFSSALSGLIQNTTYYVRAYATNSVGTAYGNQETFTTQTIVVPTVTTTVVSAINITSAISGGSVTSNGGGTLTAWGVCWSTSPNPTISNSFLQNTVNSASYSSTINGLTQNTTYYVRAYATNSAGTSYGNQETFTTLPIVIPTVTTTAISLITGCTALSGGAVTSNGGAFLTARGICWSTSPNPTIANNFLQDTYAALGSFSSSITGLTLNTTYYVRAYATNSAGTAYGNELSFTTGSLCIGQSYQGGVIAYIDASGIHGLIAAPSDQVSAPWGCFGTTTGAVGTAIGTGAQNTISIMNGCNTSGIAARVCDELVLGGYSDWYLPSKDELNQLYINRVAIGGFTSVDYWSSTEGNAIAGCSQQFGGGLGSGNQFSTLHKTFSVGVRAVRSF
jgi:hypothetical protein